MSKIEVDTIAPQSGTTVTLGESGDSINVTPGAIKDSSGNVIISKSGTTVTLGASGDTVSVASGAEFVGGGITWQSDIKTSAFTAVAGEGYWVNTTSAAVTATLPASASVGDTIEFSDYARTWNTNNITLNRNGLNYQGGTENAVYNVDGQSVRIVYSGATQGWIPTTDDDVANKGALPTYDVDFLVIAGGGGTHVQRTGGGGAGGYRNSYGSESSGGGGSSESALTFTQGTTYTITVGAGGVDSGSATTKATDGNDSSISGTGITTITSNGGGAAGGTSTGQGNGNDGGSGGGAGNRTGGLGGSGTANQGFDGGDYEAGGNEYAAGGGGAGAVGEHADIGTGDGGNGLSSSITGSAVTRGGGGGGGNAFSGTSGGSGGGGNGGGDDFNGSDGTANTGGGAGGCGNNGIAGGDGGSGVVILRMATADYSGTTTGSPTVSSSGSDTILTFNASGSYTA